MTTPRRRPLNRDNLGIETALKHHATIAPEIELGWSILRHKSNDIGWKTRTPDGDRRPPTGETHTAQHDLALCIDYGDPAGELAIRLDALAGDLDALNTHWDLVCTSLRAMATIARKHIPPSAPSRPTCTIKNCERDVEHKVVHGRITYVGMDEIAGHWVPKPGARPVCSDHRTRK